MPRRTVLTTFPGYPAIARLQPGVTLIDERPPAVNLGAGTGTVALIAEFDKGPIEAPTLVTGPNDRVARFGGLGYTIAEGPHRGASAQQSGGSEAWNGSGYMWLVNKPEPPRLILVRVDSSAGKVQFQRLACLLGGDSSVALSNGDTAVFLLNGDTTATATYTGLPASILGTGATYADLGGKTLELEYDGGDSFVVLFQATDTDIAAVKARINARAAAEIAFDTGGELELRSVIAGSQGYIRVVGGTARTALGLPLAPTQDTWTGTVNNNSVGNYVLRISRYVNGVLTNFDTDPVAGDGGAVGDLRDDLVLALSDLQVPNVTIAADGATDFTAIADDNVLITVSVVSEPAPGDVTVANLPVGVVTAAYGQGNVGNLDDISVTEQANVIDAVANLRASVDTDGLLRVCNTLTPGTGTIQGDSGAALTVLGFDTTTIADANDAADVVIPAGTRVKDSSSVGTIWVTMEDIETGTGGGDFEVRVRPFFDTDTAEASPIGTVTEILDPLPDGFVVTNAAAISRLTPIDFDNRYKAAMDKTLADTRLTASINFIVAARTSPNIRRDLMRNADTATRAGLSARKAITRGRLGITKQQAADEAAELRSVQDRVQYAFPGVQTNVDEIRFAGSKAGPGFSDTGLVDLGADSFAASAAANLPPEEQISQKLDESPFGQELEWTALEAKYDLERGGDVLTGDDYAFLIASGVLASEIDRDNGPGWAKDVTTVDPELDPSITSGSRRRMADFVIDTAASTGKPFVGKLNSPRNRGTLTERQNGWLELLTSPTASDAARIEGFEVKDITIPELRTQGFQEFRISVRTFAFMDQIVIRAITGPTVSVATDAVA